MSPPERGPVEGSSSSLGVPPPPHARSLTMLDSTLRHCHGNRSFRLCWRCLHQRPQQGRIQPENASPTQASITPRKRGAPAGGDGGLALPSCAAARVPQRGLRSPHPALEERLPSSAGSGHGQQAATGSDGRRRAAAHRLRGWKHREKRRAAPAVVPALIPEPQPFPRLLLLCRDNIIAALRVSAQSCLPPPRPACCAGSTPLLSLRSRPPTPGSQPCSPGKRSCPTACLPALGPERGRTGTACPMLPAAPRCAPAFCSWLPVGEVLSSTDSCCQMCPCLLQLAAPG